MRPSRPSSLFPDDLLVEFLNPGDRAVQSKSVDDLVINNVMATPPPASYAAPMEPSRRVTKEDVIEARERIDAASERYTNRMDEDHPRDEARRRIAEERNEAARHLTEIEGLYHENLD